jgi:hypothetical protein
VSHREHAAVTGNRDKASRGTPVLYRAPPDPEFRELTPAHHAGLSGREFPDEVVRRIALSTFCIHVMQKVDSGLDPPP